MPASKIKLVSGDKDAAPVVQDDLLGFIGYNLKRAYMLVHFDFRTTLEELNVTQRTFSVLSIVVANPGISQSDVARALGIERSGTVVIVDELENRDMIERNKVPGDRRAYALSATAIGQAAYAKAVEAVRAHEERVLTGLNDMERQTLRDLLSRIHQVGEGRD